MLRNHSRGVKEAIMRIAAAKHERIDIGRKRCYLRETLINAGKAKDIKIDSSPSLRYVSE
jgi:hypothetical protein